MSEVTEQETVDVTKGDGLFVNVKTHVMQSKNEEGKFDCILLAKAARTVLPVYDTIFGGGIISNTLKKDIQNSSSKVEEAAQKMMAEQNLKVVLMEEMIEWEIQKYGISFLRKDSKNGVKNLLWMKRALDFIMTFLENVFINMPDQSSTECANAAYDNVLKSYHGRMVSGLVKMAFNLCPSKEGLVKKLGFETTDQVHERVICLSQECRPMLNEASSILEKHDCNFPDKV